MRTGLWALPFILALIAPLGHAVPKNDCNGALLGTPRVNQISESVIHESSVVSTENLSRGAEIRLALTHPEQSKPIYGIFKSIKRAKELDLPSPNYEMAAVVLNELLGLPFDLPFTMTFEFQGEAGVLKIIQLEQLSSEKYSGRYRTHVHNLELFDFILGISNRPKSSVILTNLRLMSLDHSIALTHLPKGSAALLRVFGKLKNAWNKAHIHFKERVMELEEDALRDELADFLTPLELDQVWERVMILKTNAQTKKGRL